MHLLDWLVVGRLPRVDGLGRRPPHRRLGQGRRLSAREPQPAVVGRRPLGDGDAVERDHAGRGDRPGLRRRHALRAVLLRAADRDDHPQRDARAVLLPRPRLHRLRVPRAPLRSEDADAGERAVPLLARAVVRRDHRRARGDSLDRPRLEPDADHPRHRPADGDLHDGRRRPGGDLDRRQADGGHRRRPARGRRRARSSGCRPT